MATMHCPTCHAKMTVRSSHVENDNLVLELDADCQCYSNGVAKVTTIRPAAVPDSTPAPQHRVTRF